METNGSADNVNAGQEQDAPGIAGTTFKTPEDLAAAYQNLERKLGEQGNQLGTHRKDAEYYRSQAETLSNLLKQQQATPEKAQGPDYETEIAAIEQQIQTLDPMEEGFSKTLAGLVKKSNALTAAATHERTLGAAKGVFTEELSKRDTAAAKKAFFDQNPTFNTPEMQARIREYIANDRTGMADPLSAFREIERDDIKAQADALAAENAEYKKLIELNKGKDEAGRVVVKGQSPGRQQTQQPKVTGKALDAGMAEILRNLG
jgi:hypothetical protein